MKINIGNDAVTMVRMTTPPGDTSHRVVTDNGLGEELEVHPGGTIVVTDRVAENLRGHGWLDVPLN